MSKLLNKEIRQEIIDSVIVATYAARENALAEAVRDFADLAYLAIVPEQFIAVAASLPSNYFSRTETLEIKVIELRDGNKARRDLVNPYFSVKEHDGFRRYEKYVFKQSKPRPLPFFLAPGHGTTFLVLDEQDQRDELLDQHAQLERIADRIISERKQLIERLSSLLASIRTVERFVEIAPELKPFVPADALASKAPMPVPVVGTLITDLMQSGLKLSTVEV